MGGDIEEVVGSTVDAVANVAEGIFDAVTGRSTETYTGTSEPDVADEAFGSDGLGAAAESEWSNEPEVPATAGM
jgi:hypothetical protein